MKRLFIIIAISLITQLNYAQKVKKPINIYLGTALTQDQISWSIAGNSSGNNPNILSEVSWKNLKGTAITVGLELPVFKNLYLKGGFSRSFIKSGKATDTDYAQDNRTNPVFNAALNGEDGYLTNYQLNLGYHFYVGGLKLSPNFGYSNHIQYLHLTDNDLPDLNSTYKTLWNGLTAGLDVSKNISRFDIYTVFNYHQVNYNATANWNLIDEFKHPISFRHIAKGFGLTSDFYLLYQTKKYVSPFINFGFCYWSTGAGIDELYYNDGRIAKTRLNDVSRNGYNLGLGLKIIIPQ